jgi:predicted dehydrogenase
VPVLVEKPVAATLEDAEAMAAESRSSGVPVLVGHHRRHNPIIRAARAMIAEGRLGRVINASVLASFLKPPDYFTLEWRRQKGGGPVLINLIHEIDLVRHLCGEIASVQALTSNKVRGFEVEDSAAVLLKLVNGALVTLTLSDAAPSPWCWDLIAREGANYPPQPLPVNSHFICGTEGALTLPQLEYWRYVSDAGWYKPLDVEIAKHDLGDPYLAQLEHFCRVVRGDEVPLIDAEDGTRTLRATLAVHEAARSGALVALI